MDIDVNSTFYVVPSSGECITKFDLEMGKHRFVILSTKACLTIMARSKRLSAGATFKICPKLFAQVRIFFALVTEEQGVPVCFVLMTNRLKASYELIFQAVKASLSDLGLNLSKLSLP